MKDYRTRNLFFRESNLRIFKVKSDDAIRWTDEMEMLFQLISDHEEMYPNIKKWFKSKVLPGLKRNERVAYVGLSNQEPVVSAIVRKGADSKFCHLHIKDDYRERGIGDLFFAMMALDVRNCAKQIHFTLPESLWTERRPFFLSFGFNDVTKANEQYRLFDDELRASAPFRNVWQSVLEKLPRLIDTHTKYPDDAFRGLLMSIRPQFVEKIQRGNKVVEIRKKFNPKWDGCRITIYSSHPVRAICGYATIKSIKKGDPQNIWAQFEDDVGCTREEFDRYTESCETVYAISLKDFEAYSTPVAIDQVAHLLNKDLKPPQSYTSLEKNKPWAEAVSIAELLHGRFRAYTSIV